MVEEQTAVAQFGNGALVGMTIQRGAAQLPSHSRVVREQDMREVGAAADGRDALGMRRGHDERPVAQHDRAARPVAYHVHPTRFTWCDLGGGSPAAASVKATNDPDAPSARAAVLALTDGILGEMGGVRAVDQHQLLALAQEDGHRVAYRLAGPAAADHHSDWTPGAPTVSRAAHDKIDAAVVVDGGTRLGEGEQRARCSHQRRDAKDAIAGEALRVDRHDRWPGKMRHNAATPDGRQAVLLASRRKRLHAQQIRRLQNAVAIQRSPALALRRIRKRTP